MATRVTDAEVREVIEIDPLLTNISIFIATANNLVDRIAVKDATVEEVTLKLIERWLSAHFVAIRDMRSADEKAGSVAQSFQYKVGLNLQVTIYGQQAMMLDSTGLLSDINKNGKDTSQSYIASMEFIGVVNT